MYKTCYIGSGHYQQAIGMNRISYDRRTKVKFLIIEATLYLYI